MLPMGPQHMGDAQSQVDDHHAYRYASIRFGPLLAPLVAVTATEDHWLRVPG
jgi:hypothetical protein